MNAITFYQRALGEIRRIGPDEAKILAKAAEEWESQFKHYGELGWPSQLGGLGREADHLAVRFRSELHQRFPVSVENSSALDEREDTDRFCA